MELDRIHAHKKLLRNFLIGMTHGNIAQNIRLTLGEFTAFYQTEPDGGRFVGPYVFSGHSPVHDINHRRILNLFVPE